MFICGAWSAEASILADDYYLTNPVNNDFCSNSREPMLKQPSVMEFKSNRFSRDSDKIRDYCHKRGRWRSDCYPLKSRPKQTSNGKHLMCALSVVDNKLVTADVTAGEQKLESFLPFISEGFVSLIGSECVNILGDTSAVD